jgi:hypothetical protein
VGSDEDAGWGEYVRSDVMDGEYNEDFIPWCVEWACRWVVIIFTSWILISFVEIGSICPFNHLTTFLATYPLRNVMKTFSSSHPMWISFMKVRLVIIPNPRKEL